MTKYYELTEVKEVLDNKGIKYREVRINDAILLYVNGLMQIPEPTEEQRKQFWPDVRVSLHEGDYDYYVKACGAIYENQNIESILGLIETFCLDTNGIDWD